MVPMKRKEREKLSHQLRRIMAESGLSRYEIARRTGVQESALSRFFNGQRGLTTETLDKLGECLGLRIVADKLPKQKGR